MNTHSAFFETAPQLAQFFNATAGVQFTRDAYQLCGSLWVDFNLDALPEADVKEKVRKAGGFLLSHAV